MRVIFGSGVLFLMAAASVTTLAVGMGWRRENRVDLAASGAAAAEPNAALAVDAEIAVSVVRIDASLAKGGMFLVAHQNQRASGGFLWSSSDASYETALVQAALSTIDGADVINSGPDRNVSGGGLAFAAMALANEGSAGKRPAAGAGAGVGDGLPDVIAAAWRAAATAKAAHVPNPPWCSRLVGQACALQASDGGWTGPGPAVGDRAERVRYTCYAMLALSGARDALLESLHDRRHEPGTE